MNTDPTKIQVRAALNDMVAAAPVGIALIDRDLRFHLINTPLADMNGLPVEAHIGRTVRDIVPKLEPLVRPIIDRIFATGEGVRDYILEGETPRAPGVKRTWRENWFAVPGPAGVPLFAGVMVQDVTDEIRDRTRLTLLFECTSLLLQSDDAAAMLEALYSKIAPDLSLDAFFSFLADESESSLRLASWAGVSEVERRSIDRLEMGEGICGRVAQHRQPMCVGEIHRSNEPHVQLMKNLGIRAYAGFPLLAGTKILGTLSFASRSRDDFSQHDVNFMGTIAQYFAVAYQRMQLLNQLREAARHKDEFLAALAHELRNPLAPIRSAIEVQRLAAANPSVIEQSRAVMERQLQQLVRLVDDLLDVSRISRGRINLRRENTSLAACIHNALEMVQPHFDKAKQEVTVNLPRQPMTIFGDRTRLTQVFANLLGNASKFTASGGRIDVSARIEGPIVVVAVRDSGIGLARENLSRVFNMFSQIDATSESTQTGLGIGLALVKGLVEMHGGTVRATSAGLRQGSTFEVRLPLLFCAPPEVDHAPQPVTSGGCRIVVVDDHVDGAETMAVLLRIKGHEVATAHDGEDALRTCRAFLPDLVLLDIGLPTLTGYEVAMQIRREDWGRRTILVAMTGWGQEVDKRRAMESGFDHHLTKPVEPSELDALLLNVASKKS